MNEKVLDERKVETLTQWLKKVIVAVVVVSIVGVLYLFMARGQEKKETESFALLFVAERMERELGEVSNPFEAAFYEKMGEWTEAQRGFYTEALNKVVSEYPSSQASQLARLRLARMDVVSENYSKAESLLTHVRDEASKDFIIAQALQVLSVIYENQSKFEDALKAFDQVISLKNSPFKATAYLGKARALSALGRQDQAKTVYEKVTKDFPNSEYEKQARVLMAVGS